MAAAGFDGEDALLFDAVKAVGLELCPELDISIPVGKDSLSMQAQWDADGAAQKVGVAGVAGDHGVRARGRRAQPVDAGARSRRGCRPVADRPRRRQAAPGRQHPGQCYDAIGGAVPDLDEPERLRGVLRPHPGRACRAAAARLPRPFRRRRLRDAVRNGVRVPPRPRYRDSTTGATTPSSCCSTRNSAPSCRSPPRIARASPTWSTATTSPIAPSASARPPPRRRSASPRVTRSWPSGAGRSCSTPGGR